MSESKPSQVQQATTFWTHLWEDQIGRFETAMNELTKLEEKGVAQMQSATTDAMKLWSSSFAYGTQLAADFRKLAVEATRQGVELVTPKG